MGPYAPEGKRELQLPSGRTGVCWTAGSEGSHMQLVSVAMREKRPTSSAAA